MNRRTFLLASAALLGSSIIGGLPAARAATPTRETWWKPQRLQDGVVLEWRYLAGRITRATGEDFGFVCSLVDYKLVQNGQPRKELIVMRQELPSGNHATRTYRGTISYNEATATYSFVTTENDATASASWRFDSQTQKYLLSVATPELTLTEIELQPEGAFLPEGGDGEVTVGNLAGAEIRSDYFADWVRVVEGEQQVGYARFDIQTIRPQAAPNGTARLTHHWFCIAAEQAGQPVWVTAWRIDTPDAPQQDRLNWNLTVARGTGANWATTAVNGNAVQPLSVEILEWQPIPDTRPPKRTGSRWRVQAGQAQAGDLLDIELRVPPGQFILDARVLNLVPGVQMQEAVGLELSGTLNGQPLEALRFAVGESTYTEYALFVPLAMRS
jgi:hypothetical protein